MFAALKQRKYISVKEKKNMCTDIRIILWKKNFNSQRCLDIRHLIFIENNISDTTVSPSSD
jgi:hypothetical protein